MALRLRIVAACALALVLPGAALAQKAVVHDQTLDAYMRIAADYWHAQPSCTAPDGTPIPPDVVMSDRPERGVAAWAEMPGCRIWLDKDFWPAPPDEQHCNLIAHEWGHLLGHDHSAAQPSLMWGGWTNNVVPACAAYRPAPVRLEPRGPTGIARRHKLRRRIARRCARKAAKRGHTRRRSGKVRRCVRRR